jgi:DNA-binding NtrC family response regulator
MPPLRERREDIPLLANAFLKEFAAKNNKQMELEPAAMELLQVYPWKGNVRELRAAIEGAVVLGRRDRIGLRELPAAIRNFNPGAAETANSSGPKQSLTVEQAERQLILQALTDARGNRTEAAERLGISRRTLHRKLHAYHLEGF